MRFFIIKNLLDSEEYADVSKFVYLDSDILCYTDFSRLNMLNEYDFGMCVSENQNNYKWIANCGISFFSRHALGELILFFVNTYEKNIKLIKEKWDYQQKENLPGGVCDMTLEYLFYRDTSLGSLNLAMQNTKLPGIMDANVNSANNYLEDEYEKDDVLGIKKIVYENGMPNFVDKNGKNVPVLAIHFNGPAKKYMETYARNKMCTRDIYNIEKRKKNKQAFKNAVKKILGR